MVINERLEMVEMTNDTNDLIVGERGATPSLEHRRVHMNENLSDENDKMSASEVVYVGADGRRDQ